MHKVHFSSQRLDWKTPKSVYQMLDAEFNFDYDPCPSNFVIDGLTSEWKSSNFVNPPYSSSPFLPLILLNRTKKLIMILSRSKDALGCNSSLEISMPWQFRKSDYNISLNFLDNERWVYSLKNGSNIPTVDNPSPRDAFVELSWLLSYYHAQSEIVAQEINDRFMDHLDFDIKSVDISSLHRLISGTKFSLMDAYTSFIVNDSGDISKFFHGLIIPSVGEFIKWARRGTGGCAEWLAKGYIEAQKDKTVVFLIPSRTDTSWWHSYCMKADEIRFIRGRLRFDDHKNSAPFPSAIVIFRAT